MMGPETVLCWSEWYMWGGDVEYEALNDFGGGA